MKRRDVITLAAGAATWPFARPLAAEAQRRVGALLISPGNNQSELNAFREGLATFGWVEGRNLRIDYRLAGDPSRLAADADAEELVNLRPEVIFALSGPAALAVQQRTSIIPIVFAGLADGLVRNTARPEGNMTGFALEFGSLAGKWLELFKEAVPRLTRVADIFFVSGFPSPSPSSELRATIAAAAAQLGVTVTKMPVRNAVEIEPAISAISAFAAEPDGGLLLSGAAPSAMFEAIRRRALYYLAIDVRRGFKRPSRGFPDSSWS
jgi:putative ABC transport system substrate-binding protein